MIYLKMCLSSWNGDDTPVILHRYLYKVANVSPVTFRMQGPSFLAGGSAGGSYWFSSQKMVFTVSPR